MPSGTSQNGVGRPGFGAPVVVGSGTVVVVVADGVVLIDVVLVATVVAADCGTVGSEVVVRDGEPHEAATKPIAATTATLRAMLMCEV